MSDVPFVFGFGLGCIPSPPDERDYQYRAYARVLAASELPREYTCPNVNDLGTDNQGSVSSCVAHSLGYIKDWQERKELNKLLKMSRQFIYANRVEGQYKGPGMIPREALENLRLAGTPPYDVWPGIKEIGFETWPEDRAALFAAAQPFQLTTYVAIDRAYIQEMKSAIMQTGPILYCIPIYQNFAVDSEGRIPQPNGFLRGYHATVIIGWTENYWLVQNSWGYEWGKFINGLGGRCWVPWNFPAQEVWGVTDATTKRKRHIDLVIGSKTMLVNGRKVDLDVAPFIVPVANGGRTVLELRGIGEAFGAKFDYGPKDGKVEWVTVDMEEAPL